MGRFAESLKALAARLPESWQFELKRLHYRRSILRGRFAPDEPEDKVLDALIRPGDWVLDIGANIGHYTRRFSELVGPDGRVIAFEPVPATFSLVAGNAAWFPQRNVTLLNLAASDGFGEVGFSIPLLSSGLKNYYMASVDPDFQDFRVACVPVDALRFPGRISLVKVDVEGHELQVLHGMARMLESDRPMLIVETHSDQVKDYLRSFGYSVGRLRGSPNVLAIDTARSNVIMATDWSREGFP